MPSTDIAPWYKKYTGMPYKHLGQDPALGIDCFNLCALVYEKELDIVLPYKTYDFCNIADDVWYQKTNKELILTAATSGVENFEWSKVSSPKTYDIITLSIGATNITNHCALYLGNNKMLQIMDKKVSWVAPYGNYYKQYTTGIFRWKTTNN